MGLSRIAGFVSRPFKRNRPLSDHRVVRSPKRYRFPSSFYIGSYNAYDTRPVDVLSFVRLRFCFSRSFNVNTEKVKRASVAACSPNTHDSIFGGSCGPPKTRSRRARNPSPSITSVTREIKKIVSKREGHSATDCALKRYYNRFRLRNANLVVGPGPRVTFVIQSIIKKSIRLIVRLKRFDVLLLFTYRPSLLYYGDRTSRIEQYYCKRIERASLYGVIRCAYYSTQETQIGRMIDRVTPQSGNLNKLNPNRVYKNESNP